MFSVVLVLFSCAQSKTVQSKIAESITTKSEQLPNVILIYADDLGYGDLICQGAT